MITLVLMKRDRNNTVTKLPVLIPTGQRDAEGFVALGDQKSIKPVRSLRSEDLKGSHKIMAEHEAKHFYAVTMLSRALSESPDLLAVHKACDLLAEAYLLKSKSDKSGGHCLPPFPEPENAEEEQNSFSRAFTELLSVPPETNLRALLKGTAKRDPRWLLSVEISTVIQDAKIVLWWTRNEFKPAIWCPDVKTAFYVHAIMGAFRICLHCSEPFLPQRPDQDYCSVAHREAHRVARWRSKQKIRKTGNRRNDGTQKTR